MNTNKLFIEVSVNIFYNKTSEFRKNRPLNNN